MSSREHYKFHRADDDKNFMNSFTKKSDNFYTRSELKEPIQSQTQRDHTYSHRIELSPIAQRIKARETRKEEMDKKELHINRPSWRGRTSNSIDESRYKIPENTQYSNISSNRPEIKLLDLSKVAKPPLVSDPSEKSFIILKSYYESETDLNAKENPDESPVYQASSLYHEKGKKDLTEERPERKTPVGIKKDSHSGKENNSQLEFVEIPCAQFFVDDECDSRDDQISFQDGSPMKDDLKESQKVKELTKTIEKKDLQIKLLQNKNEQLLDEVNKMKQQMAKQIEILTSEVNQAKEMVLSTSTLLPSMPDTARSRSGKSPIGQSDLAVSSGTDSDQLHSSLAREIAEVCLQLLSNPSTSDALKSFIEMSIRRIRATTDLFSLLRSTKDLVTASVEGMDRIALKFSQRITDLETRCDKEKQKNQTLQDEVCQFKWQNTVLNTCFENFQFISSIIARGSKTIGRSYSTCSREYFEEAHKLLKKSFRRRDQSNDEADFSYLHSLVRQIGDCIS